jgi:hypothetical protein
MQVDYNNYKTQKFTCEKCKWTGFGSELVHGDFSDSDFIGDLECPKCSHLIAFWQAPLKSKTD